MLRNKISKLIFKILIWDTEGASNNFSGLINMITHIDYSPIIKGVPTEKSALKGECCVLLCIHVLRMTNRWTFRIFQTKFDYL